MAQQNLNKTDIQIRLKKGTRANLKLPATELVGVQGEPAYCTDTEEFYIHNGTSFKPPNFNMLVAYENEPVYYENEAVIYY